MYSTCTRSSKSHVKLMPEILLWVWPIVVMVISIYCYYYRHTRIQIMQGQDYKELMLHSN